MKIIVELLTAYMEKHKITVAILAQEMGVTENEVNKLLCGEAVNEATARAFIFYFGVDEAVKMIDWAAIGKKNPFTD